MVSEMHFILQRHSRHTERTVANRIIWHRVQVDMDKVSGERSMAVELSREMGEVLITRRESKRFPDIHKATSDLSYGVENRVAELAGPREWV